jgi:hypothetical protein
MLMIEPDPTSAITEADAVDRMGSDPLRLCSTDLAVGASAITAVNTVAAIANGRLTFSSLKLAR